MHCAGLQTKLLNHLSTAGNWISTHPWRRLNAEYPATYVCLSILFILAYFNRDALFI